MSADAILLALIERVTEIIATATRAVHQLAAVTTSELLQSPITAWDLLTKRVARLQHRKTPCLGLIENML